MPFAWEPEERAIRVMRSGKPLRALHQRMLEAWAAYLSEGGLSELTIETYLIAAARACDRLEARGRFVFSVDRDEWRRWETEILYASPGPLKATDGSGNGWLRFGRAVLRTLFHWWIYVGDHRLQNPFVDLTPIVGSRITDERELRESELERLFRYLKALVEKSTTGGSAEAYAEYLVYYLAFGLLYLLALRPSELASIECSHVTRLADGAFTICVRRQGQRLGEWTWCRVPDVLTTSLAAWMDRRPLEARSKKKRLLTARSVRARFAATFKPSAGMGSGSPADRSDALFIHPRKRSAISRAALNHHLRAFTAAAGLAPEIIEAISCSWLRNSRRAALIAEGVRESLTRAYLGLTQASYLLRVPPHRVEDVERLQAAAAFPAAAKRVANVA